MADKPEQASPLSIAPLWPRILAGSYDEIYIFDAETLKFIQVSRGALDNLGYDMGELRELAVSDLKSDVSGEEFEALIQPLRSGEQNLVVFETRHRRKDGSLYPVEVRLQLAADQTPPVFIAIILDITARKLAEEALHNSEKRFYILAQVSPVGIYRTDAEGQCVYVNERWCEMAGITATQALGEGWMGAIHPDDRERVFREWRAAARRRIPFRSECRFQRPDGQVSWLLVQASAEHDAEGRVRGFVGSATDITLHKRIEATLREIASVGTGRPFFRKLAQSLAGLFDARAVIVGQYLAEAPDRIDTLGLCVDGDLVENVHFNLAGSPCEQVIRQAGVVSVSSGVRESFPDSNCRVMQDVGAQGYVGSPILDGVGRPIGIIAILDDRPIEDIDTLQPVLEVFSARAAAEMERLKAEQLVKNQRDELERLVTKRTAELTASNKELEAFAYSVSHDLRAPLRAIDGFSHILLDDHAAALDEAAQKHLQRVRAASQRMGALIDDLLQLSRLSREALRRESVDMSTLAGDRIAELRAAEPGRDVEVIITPGIEVHGDRRLLGVILENLLGNAWKYSGKTPVARIEFGVTERDGERVFFVRDNGAGFDMRYVDKLFVAFQRLHSSSQYEGTGIGLATVQRVVQRHNGRIWAEAEVGRGACFYFTLQ